MSDPRIPNLDDPDLDEVPRNALGARGPAYPAVLDCLDRWMIRQAKLRPGQHGLGTFLRDLADAGYQVAPLSAPPPSQRRGPALADPFQATGGR